MLAHVYTTQEIIEKLRKFANDRDWEQFHSPKNLAMALSVEISEITEVFQWLSEEQSLHLNESKLQQVKDEIGDSMIYLLRLADRLGIDPLEATVQKISKNEIKYPVDKVRGRALKYTDLDE